MTDAPVLVERRGPKLYLTLNRPEVINALTLDMLRIVDRALDEAERDEAIRVILLQGVGERGFCAGLDTMALAELQERGAEEGPLTFVRLTAIAKRLDSFAKPVIALIYGHVIAAGAQLATAADVVIAGESLKLLDTELRATGLTDESWPIRLGRTLGKLRANRLLLLGERLDASTAQQLGLVTLVVPDDQLIATGEGIADRIAGYEPAAVARTLLLVEQGAYGQR
ncbi:MAG: enoyl-CoA hydratase/isomerase family protein [Dehalococcoidia bacterium]